MISRISLLLLFLATYATSNAQQARFWKTTNASFSALEHDVDALIMPDEKRTFTLDFEALSLQLAQFAPVELKENKGLIVNLPLPNGEESFQLFYSPVVEPGLQEKYPNIRSYKGYGVEDPSKIVRMTVSPLGLKASILTKEGEIYIDPLVNGKTVVHASYFVKDYARELVAENIPACGTNDIFDDSPLDGLNMENAQGNNLRSGGEPINLRTFRAAIACTGEWSGRQGGKDAAVAKLIACVDRGNQIFENEVGFRLILVSNNDLIVFADPESDPYSQPEPKSGRDLIGMNTTVLNARIGQNFYDIGHVFTLGCSDVGGVASLASVCGNNKGSGTTCWYNNNLEYTVVRIMCHEMGHQFSAPHTFNNCGGNESFGTGYEPGSGSTIMSYGGLCGNNNVVSGGAASRDITYYHCNSLMRMYTFSRGASCGSQIPTNNTRPQSILDYENGFYIPHSTPFYLEGTGIDMEDDELTYCFEQHDFSSRSCPLGQPTGDCPAFRSFPPVEENYRVFPSFGTIWNNQTSSSITEVLPEYDRRLTFVLSVRDNNAEVGTWGMDTMFFNATTEAGPFIVTAPNRNLDYVGGTYQLVEWEVANTNLPPVNCQNVDILIYRNASWENFELLKAGTANDGSEWVFIPEQIENNVKIMVRSSDNIFFDISDVPFSVENATAPDYSLGLSENSARICLPDIFTTELLTTSVGGFQGQLEFDIISGVPNGATYQFENQIIDVSQSTNLQIDFTNVTESSKSTIVVRAISDQQDTIYRNIELDIVRNDFSQLTANYPNDGIQGVEQSPILEWEDVTDAYAYNVQLASNATFEPGSIIQEWFNVTDNSVQTEVLLEKNSIFYWRVQPINDCGPAQFIRPAAFSTEAATCRAFESPDRNVGLQRGQTVELGINIFENAEVNDVNVNDVIMTAEFLQDVKLSLVSPSQTEVILINNKCGNTTEIDCNFDDDAATSLKCPPIQGRDYQPIGQLSTFNGESAQGKWSLRIELSDQARSSSIERWGLEVCANTVLDGPFMVNNDTLKMKPSESRIVGGNLLFADDNNNSASELIYTITQLPLRGDLMNDGNLVSFGGTFTQADIQQGKLTYQNTDGIEGVDNFYFTVNDGEGGWTGTHAFEIEIDDNFASSNNDLEQRSFFNIFPNPNDGQFTLFIHESADIENEIFIINSQGQIVENRTLKAGEKINRLNLNYLPGGAYLVRCQNDRIYSTQRIIISR